jgi:hypothetical protein
VKSVTFAILLTAVLTGCTTPEAAKPPATGAPPVTQPHLSFSTYSGKPCQVLGVDQLKSFGVSTAGTPDAVQPTALCRWRSDSATTIGLTLFGAQQGLPVVYAAKGRFRHFQPTEVEKYPAVDRDAGEATTGTCATVVGIADDTAFEVQVQVDEKGADYRTPCAVSKQVATVAVNNLLGGG